MSKSISKPKNKITNFNTAKGLWAEHVVCEHFSKNSYQLMAQRYQIQKVEIDLIFKKDQNWVFVEVKFLDNTWRAAERVSRKQIGRLQKINQYLKFNRKIKSLVFVIALVEKNRKIHWLNLSDYNDY